MGDLSLGSSDANSNEGEFCRKLNFKIFNNRSTCKLVDVYLVPRINNPGLTIKIPAHKLIIQNFQFFSKLLESNNSSSQGQGPVDLQINSDPISTQIMLRYIYTGQLDLNGQNLLKLLLASKYFELPNLTQKCLLFLHKDESYLNIENWLDLFRFAMTEGGRGLRLKIFEFLRSNIDQLLQSDDLPTLDFNEIKMLMEPSNRIFPAQYFNKVMLNWTSFQPDRRQYIDELSELKWDDIIVVDLASDNENLIDQNIQIQQNNQIDQNIQIQQNNQIDQIENIQMAKRPRLSVNHQIIFRVQVLSDYRNPNPGSLYTFSFEDLKVSKLAFMPIESAYFGLISTKNRLFLLGGYNKNDYKKWEEMYSINLHQQEPSSVPHLWKREINLLHKSDEFSTILVKGSIYVVGGKKDESSITIPYIYLLTLDENETALKWTFFCNMKMARCRAGVAVINNVMYISGGRARNQLYKTSKDSTSDSFEMVDLDTKIGRILQNMIIEKYDHQLVAFNDKLYAIGGMNKDRRQKGYLFKSKSVEIYDPVSGNWTVGKSMLDARRGFVAFVAEGNIIVLGGNDGNPSMEKFDPVANSWSRIECPVFPNRSNFGSYTVHITN